jgi:hypothetical protein
MTDIPEDVMKAALAAWTSVPTAEWEANAVEIIARAILTERERCARLAESDGSSHDAPYPHSPEWRRETCLQVKTADRIAAAIRARRP